MADQAEKRARKLLCPGCLEKQKRGKLITPVIQTQCHECGVTTAGTELVHCAGCAEENGRCTWCGTTTE